MGLCTCRCVYMLRGLYKYPIVFIIVVIHTQENNIELL